ncbi:MAG: GNAT family N-acetyltransferase [Mariniphaga sp.]|nr:GNAT family N-acetyltransferase [Mariniphaga sp.]
MSSIRYKIATEDDILSLSELFLNVYGEIYSEKELHWRYLNNPVQKGKLYNCIAITDCKEIVGHTGFIKHTFVINGKTYYGGLTVGSAVKKNNSGIFAPMYNYLEKSLGNEFDFLYGYPNQNSYPFFIKLFGYAKLYSSMLQIEPSNDFTFESDKFNRIFDIIVSSSRHIEPDFLLWRIIDNPLHKYYYYKYKDSIVFWKMYNENEIDIVGISSVSSIVNIDREMTFPMNSRINILLTSEQKRNKLKKEGFYPLMSSNNYVIKINRLISDFDPTFFQMLDLDLF